MITLNLAKATVAAIGPPHLIAIAFVGVVLVIGLMISLVFLKFFKLWLQAKLSRAEVTYAELVGMYLRHSDYRTIVLSRITAVQVGLDLSTRDLESHFLAGGRIANVVRALILAKRENIELSWQDATAMDLDSRDVYAEVKSAVDGETGPMVQLKD
jgi:uncharacterized protein YqfA (UPF0365 family)